MLILYLIIILVLMILVSLYLRKKHDIIFDFFVIYRPVSQGHKLFERIFLIFSITLMISVYFILTSTLFGIYLILFASFTILEGVRAYMEYKHFRKAKAYIIHTVSAVGNFLLFIGVLVAMII